jgi:hypothetical protein
MIEKLSKEQMLNVHGGVSRGEYCDGLKSLIVSCYARWSDAERFSAGSALEGECTSHGY